METHWNESRTSKEPVGLIGIIISVLVIFGESHGRLGVQFTLYLTLIDIYWE
jgi:hypothetical protein